MAEQTPKRTGEGGRRTRRQFLTGAGRGAVAAAAALALGRSRRIAAAAPAHSRVRLAVIGTGGMGNRHIDSLVKNPRCEVVALSDCWRQRYEATAAKIEQATGKRPEGYQDFRRVLDRDDVDAVLVSTPPHWHALMTIMACQAGKDVYVEKPLAPTVVEGRAAVEAARRYGRVVQVGTQQRSQALFLKAMDIVHSGVLGTITQAVAWIGPNHMPTDADLYEAYEAPPPDLDWDLWLGPTPYYPYSKGRHLKWYVHDEYYPGREIINWGPHLYDTLLWGIRRDRPLSVQAASGNFISVGGGDGKESVTILYEFPGCIVGWEQHYQNTHANKGYGMRFHGTQGRLIVDRTSFVVEPSSLGFAETFEEIDPWIDVDSHHNNFFDCMESRGKPNADIEIGQRSNSMCILGAIACDVPRKLFWEGGTERFVGDEQADRHLRRPYRAPWHL